MNADGIYTQSESVDLGSLLQAAHGLCDALRCLSIDLSDAQRMQYVTCHSKPVTSDDYCILIQSQKVENHGKLNFNKIKIALQKTSALANLYLLRPSLSIFIIVSYAKVKMISLECMHLDIT